MNAAEAVSNCEALGEERGAGLSRLGEIGGEIDADHSFSYISVCECVWRDRG